MASYYVGKKPVAVELQEGGLYAVQEEDVFHRSDASSNCGTKTSL